MVDRRVLTRGLALALGFAALVVGPRAGFALDPRIRLADYNRRVFTVADGLPHAQVVAIAQTPDGFLWLGSPSGLTRFDGVSFTPANQPNAALVRSTSVWKLLADRQGTLWMVAAVETGLARLRAGRVELVSTEVAGQRQGIRSIREDPSGTLWFAGSGGLTQRRGETWTKHTQPDGQPLGPAFALCVAPDGSLWLVSDSAGVQHLRDGRVVPIPGQEKLPRVGISTMVVDSTGVLWIGTSAAGLIRFEGGVARTFTTRDGLASDTVRSLHADREGSLWIGTAAGLNRLRDGRFESLTRRDGLADDLIGPFMEDREGNLWVGSGGGLIRLNEGKFSRLPLPPELTQVAPTTALQTQDGAVWVGSGQHLLRYQGVGWTRPGPPGGVCVEQIRVLEQDRTGALWIGGDKGARGRANLCRLDGDRTVDFTSAQGLPDKESIRSLFEDGNGTLWAGSSRLYRVTGDRVEAIPHPPEDNGDFFSLRGDRDGGLWAATTEVLLHRTAGGVWQRFTTPGEVPVFFSVNAAASGKGSRAVWAGMQRGLGRVRDGRLTPFRSDNGFVDDPVFQILEDRQRDLWLCTPRAIIRISRSEIDRTSAGDTWSARYTRFVDEDGMAGYTCGTVGSAASFVAHDGALWFLGRQGLLSIDPAKVSANRVLPTAVVDRISLDTRAADPASSPVAPPGRGDVRVDYTAASLAAAGRVRFRYRLEPHDPDWIEAEDRRSAFYTNLAPGPYRFSVRAGTDDGAWHPSAAAITFTLSPHFHQRLSFRLLLAALLAALVWAIHRLRIRQINLRHTLLLAERGRIARDFHDVLAQGFTGISIQIEAALDKLQSAPDKARKNLDSARLLARMSLAEAHEVVWNLRMTALDAGGLPGALARLGEQIDIAHPVTVTTFGAVRPVPSSHEVCLLRIGQEALTNAFRHARASRIEFELRYEDRGISLRYHDDGVGFDPEALAHAQGHFGLLGMRERAVALGGSMTINSRAGEGTEIMVRLPLDDS